MALITCPECKKTVSSKAAYCVNCGYPFQPMTEAPNRYTPVIQREKEPFDPNKLTDVQEKKAVWIAVWMIAHFCYFNVLLILNIDWNAFRSMAFIDILRDVVFPSLQYLMVGIALILCAKRKRKTALIISGLCAAYAL